MPLDAPSGFVPDAVAGGVELIAFGADLLAHTRNAGVFERFFLWCLRIDNDFVNQTVQRVVLRLRHIGAIATAKELSSKTRYATLIAAIDY